MYVKPASDVIMIIIVSLSYFFLLQKPNWKIVLGFGFCFFPTRVGEI
jgi:hypothetical protein